ncbi:Phosphofurin acidic cluster sorting protein 2 [Acropora cervicornis]|uniref:Phosphofurin acidic cluster sorting protein 2 n=1 Tax=Acropora cervicornis TaxID=6130 RepID=A0AAD9QW35_ACRCE|nr:Phosphofurin acidic cluster sorting protein 2 [Acropora cervicornis]
MADAGVRRDVSASSTPQKPFSMKLFATWEVERTSPNCVPRLCTMTLKRLEIIKPLESNLSEVIISVSMQSSRRILRSNEIGLPSSGLVDTELDLSFSLQNCRWQNYISSQRYGQSLLCFDHPGYPHFLKRSGNNLQVMLQRRKKYKNRTILGFKTLAVGLVNMGQAVTCKIYRLKQQQATVLTACNLLMVLQHSVENQLKLYMKGSPVPVAQITVNSLTRELCMQTMTKQTNSDLSSFLFLDLNVSNNSLSCVVIFSLPVDTDGERMAGSTVRGDVEENSSDDDDDYSLSDQEGSDSAGDADILDVEQRRGGKIRHGKITIPAKHQKNFKQKFVALLKKFKVTEEELEQEIATFQDNDISPPENEAGDEFLFPDDLEDLDSDLDNEFLDDSISIVSTPKPSLRPFFDPRSSTENVRNHAVIEIENSRTVPYPSQSEQEDVHADHDMEMLSPPSDGENLSDSTNTSDALSGGGLEDVPSSVRRSVSFKERRKTETPTRRRNSDIDLQLPQVALNEQLSTVLSGDLPESILLISTSEWQGQLLALKLCDKAVKMICTRSCSDVQAVFLAIVNKYQKFCSTNSASPPHLSVAIAGAESYISEVLQAYVEHFSSKPSDWQTFLRILLIPLDSQPLAKYIASLDPKYNSLFMDNVWKDAFEHSDTTVDFEEVSRRVKTFMSAATVTRNLPIAEALVNTKSKGSDEGSSQIFLPFVCDVRIGSTDQVDEEPIDTSGQPTSAGTKSTGTNSRFENLSPAAGSPQTPPNTSSPVTSLHEGGSGGGGVWSSELMELQVDYWLVAGNKKDVNKSSLKTTFKTLVVSRLPPLESPEEPSALQVMAVTKERNKRGLEAMMRSRKKSKERDTESKNQPVVANVSKLICASKGQSSTLNVVIDGVTWSGVKFFALSSQWPTHIKYFPMGIFSRVETTC